MVSGIPLYAGAVGLCLGIAAAFIFGIGYVSGVIFFGAAVVLFAAVFLAPKRIQEGFSELTKFRLVITGLLCAACAIGIMRAHYSIEQFSKQNILSFASSEPTMTSGVIVDDPDRRDTTTHIVVAVSKINDLSARGTLVAYLPPRQPVAYGDTVTMQGTIQPPEPFAGDTGNSFDYPHYLQVQHISAVLAHARIESIERSDWPNMGTLYEIKAAANASIEKLYTPPDSFLLEGMLFGERHALPKDLEQTLVSVGLIHIVILAGYALGLVADGIRRSTKFLPRGLQFAVVTLLLICYILMTGAAAPTVRAGIMAIIAMVARVAERSTIPLRSFAAAGAGMALWNPPILLYDSSFIISALATFGLITLAPAIENVFHFLPEKFELRQIATATASVQLFSLPALIYFTGNFSLVSIPANLLALPALPYAMFFGFLSVLAHAIHPMLAYVPAIISSLLARYIIFIAQSATAIPFGATVIANFPLWAMLLIYVPLIALALRSYRSSITSQL